MTPAPRNPSTRLLASLAALVVLMATVVAISARPAEAYAGAPWFKPGEPYVGNFPDPTIVRDGNTYWAYGTSTGGSLMPAMSSTNLVTWTPRPAYSPNPYNGDPFFNDSFPVPPSWSMNGTNRNGNAQWAPGVAKFGSTWVAYTSWSVTPSRRCISMATASSPAGPFRDLSPFPFQCDSDPNGSIDPQPFFDGNGTPYLMWKSAGIPGSTPTRLWSRQLSSDGRSFASGSTPRLLLQTELPWEGNSIENPSMVRYAGGYWLIYSGNEWRSGDYRTGQAACAGPLGPCTRTSGSPLLPNTASELSPGGGTLFTDGAGRLRMIYQVWNAPFTDYPANPNCDGPGICASQGQRYYRTTGLVVANGSLVSSPLGTLDQATGSPGAIDLSGWAFDPASTGAIDVHVYVDGVGAGATRANQSRTDVGSAFPGMGNFHGYSARVAASTGTHQVCTYGIHVGPSNVNPILACKTVTVPPPADAPVGNLERAVGGVRTISLGGWALDRSSTASIPVHLYVDGQWGGAITADDSRPDVGAIFGKGANHGFNDTIAAAPGVHRVCAYAIHVGPSNLNPNIGCRLVNVLAPGQPPTGNLESLTATSSGFRLSGWTFDPDVARTSIDVLGWVDGVPVVRQPANGTRADVGSVFPMAGDNHGFQVDLPASRGTHYVCLVAVDGGGGSQHVLLGGGCRVVTRP